MKAYVNKESCMFCGMCGGACPDVFRADTDGKSVSLDTEFSEELLPMVRHAESICPTWAISVKEAP